MKNKKTILLVSILAIIILGVIGVAYAYSSLFTGNNQQLVLGDIYMHYNETNQLVLEGVMPSESYDISNYFEFTINGKNTYQDKDIYYEIVLNHGDDHTTRTERIKDNLLKFTLVEIKDNTETIVVNGESFDEINGTRLWANTISKNTITDVNVTYRLYMWMSDETTICGGGSTGCDYDIDTWNDKVYASIKVNVTGDFTYKTADRKAPVITSVIHAGEGKITFTTTDDNSGVVEYCVNQEATDTTNCTWLAAIEGEQTTDVITTEDGIYYVHVKDRGENIGHSKKVIIALTVIEAPILGVKVSNYLEAIDETFTGGLVAINGTDGDNYGDVYNENDTTQTIREYRYSGTDVNNYVYFNCKDSDGTYNYGDLNYNYASNCEIWRIVGIFNEDGEQVLKIMRNTMLTSDELPASYVVDGTTYKIENGTSGTVYWNKPDSFKSSNYNDWTTAGLQYFLNTESDTNSTAGYLSALTTNAEELIRTTTYNLGNVEVVYEGSSNDTTITAYTAERDTSNIHSGNYGTWSGKVALLYPSDYGYSADSTHWNTDLYTYNTTAATTSWMQQNANHTTYEWLLSPSSSRTNSAMFWSTTGYVTRITVNYSRGVRPCLYLTSSAKILQGTGESSSPYVFIK